MSLRLLDGLCETWALRATSRQGERPADKIMLPFLHAKVENQEKTRIFSI